MFFGSRTVPLACATMYSACAPSTLTPVNLGLAQLAAVTKLLT
jgi:hypothetical protein